VGVLHEAALGAEGGEEGFGDAVEAPADDPGVEGDAIGAGGVEGAGQMVAGAALAEVGDGQVAAGAVVGEGAGGEVFVEGVEAVAGEGGGDGFAQAVGNGQGPGGADFAGGGRCGGEDPGGLGVALAGVGEVGVEGGFLAGVGGGEGGEEPLDGGGGGEGGMCENQRPRGETAAAGRLWLGMPSGLSQRPRVVASLALARTGRRWRVMWGMDAGRPRAAAGMKSMEFQSSGLAA
jgi:hypothetical protein